eukprot:4201803-Prymnesium_polylepis.1
MRRLCCFSVTPRSRPACRITIERAFGILTKRFLVLKRPYGGKLSNMTLMVTVCMKLHNLLLDCNERDQTIHSPDLTGESDSGVDLTRRPVVFDNSHMSSSDSSGASPPLDPAHEMPRPLNSLDPNGPAWFDDDISPRHNNYGIQAKKGARHDTYCPERTRVTNTTIPDFGLHRPDPGSRCKKAARVSFS